MTGAAVPVPAWRWFGSPGHFICARWCRFHLTTQVGPWLVSTVGEYVPVASARTILGEKPSPRDERLGGELEEAEWVERNGFSDIGCDRKYETMVFRAGEPCAAQDCRCGQPTIDGSEVAAAPANDRRTANENHARLCALFARRDKSWKPEWETTT